MRARVVTLRWSMRRGSRSSAAARVLAGATALVLLAGCGDAAAPPVTTDAAPVDAPPVAIDAPPDARPPRVDCQWGTPGMDRPTWVDVDADGYRYVVGNTTGEFAGAVSAGEQDVFVSKVDAGGEVVWTRQWGTAVLDRGDVLFVAGGALLVVWERDLEDGPTHQLRLRRMALADGALLDERVLPAPPTARALTGILDPAGFTLAGSTVVTDDIHASEAPWLARYELDGDPTGSWQGGWFPSPPCPSRSLGSLAWLDGTLHAGGNGVVYLPETCELGYVLRFSPAIQRLGGALGDGGLGVLAVGGDLYSASAPLRSPWRTTFRRAGVLHSETPGRHELGRGDAPVTRGWVNFGGAAVLSELDPAGGFARSEELPGVFLTDALAARGHVLAVGVQGGDAYLVDLPP